MSLVYTITRITNLEAVLARSGSFNLQQGVEIIL